MKMHNPAGDTAVSSIRRRRRRGKKKATSQIVDQMDVNLEASKIKGDCEMANNNMEMDLFETVSTVKLLVEHPTTDGRLMGDLSRGKKRKRSKRNKMTQINDGIQSMDLTNSMPNALQTDKNLRPEIDDEITKSEGAQNTNHNKMDVKSTVGLAEGSMNAKRKRKRKRVKSKVGNNKELETMDQSNSMSYVQLSDESLKKEIDDKLAKNEGVQHTNQDMIDFQTVELAEDNVNQSMGQSRSVSIIQLLDKKFRQEIHDELAEKVDVQHTDLNLVDVESTVNPAEGNVSAKRKKNKRKKRNKNKLQSMDRSKSMPNLQPDNSLREEIDDKLTESEGVQGIDQEKMDIESTYNLAEGSMSRKTKKRRKKAKSKNQNKDEVHSVDQANDITNLGLSKNNIGREIDGKLIENDRTAQESDFPAGKEYKTCHSDHLADMVEVSNKSASSEVLEERSVPFAGPMGLGGKVYPRDSQQEDVKFVNALNEVNNGIFVVDGITSLAPSCVKEAEFLSKDLGEYPIRPPITTDRRKLLILDVNGLLACIVMPRPKGCKADINILRRAVFKRPFCDDFLKFCFQNFDVGIWSSRSKVVIDRIVDYLLGNLKKKLLFCWNMSHSTQTGFKTLEDIHKPLVCKELRKIWENDGPKFSWKKGQYDESNTLLVDDSPYKALLNPLHTAIFPHSYHYEDKDDNSLGPGGDLRVYMEGLLKSINVQEYVSHHPFGQSAINETNVSWQFYSGVLKKFSNKIQARKKATPVLTSSQNLTSPPPDNVLDLERDDNAHSTDTPVNTVDPEVPPPIHSSLVVSASQ